MHKLLLIAAVATIGAVIAGVRADAHSWYPNECCGGYDCAPLDAGAVELTPDGWLIRETGEVIPTAHTRESEDGRFHRCRANPSVSSSPTREAGGTRCFFVPPGGS